MNARARNSQVEATLNHPFAAQVEKHRHANLGLITAWDADLSYALQPALAAYENERLTGSNYGADDFQDTIRRILPPGHCFKSFPNCFPHVSAERMVGSLLRSDLGADILNAQGSHVRHALRVRVFPYAEDVCAVWIMVAVRFLKT